MKNVEINTRKSDNARHAIIAAGLAMFALVLLLPSAAHAQCMTPPTFGGIGAVANPANATCTLNLSWNAATPTCGGTVMYAIYRSTTKGFTADASTRIASDVIGTTYADNADLVSGTRYYYKVRALSTTNWVEDTNIVEKSGTSAYEWSTPVIFRDSFDLPDRPANPAAWWTFGVFFGDNDNKSDIWLSSLCGAYSGLFAYRFGQQGQCNKYSSKEESSVVLGGDGTLDPLINGFNVPANVENAQLKFMHRYALEDFRDGGHLMYSLTGPTAGYVEIPDTFTPGEPFIETGGYDGVIPTTTGPVRAWTGIHSTWSPVVVNIAELTGKKVWFVWRFSTDNNNAPTWPAPAQTGYWFDDIQVDWTIATGSCTTCPGPVKVLTARAGSYTNGSGVQRGSVKLEWTAKPGAQVKLYRDLTYFTTVATDGNGYGFHLDQDLNLDQAYAYEASVSVGAQESRKRSVSATPRNTAATPVKWSYVTGASALNPIAISGAIFTGSNDRLVHAVTLKPTGGDWPRTTPFSATPVPLNAPAQGRIPVGLMNGQRVGLAGALDGTLSCFNALTGAEIWRTAASGAEMIAAPPTAALRSSGTGLVKDLILYGTRNSSAANKIVAVDAANGNFVWQFDNGASTDATKALGIITGAPLIDAANKRLWFTTRKRAGGSPFTLWSITFNDTGATAQWWADIGDSDSAPALRNGMLYVGTNSGNVTAFTAVPASGGLQTPVWTYATADGPVKLGVMVDFFSNWIFLSTTNRLWALEGGPLGVTVAYSSAAGEIPNPSRPLYASSKLYVGASDGSVHVVSGFKTGAPVRTTIPVAAGRVLGNPAMDFQNNLLHIGSDNGIIYAVQP